MESESSSTNWDSVFRELERCEHALVEAIERLYSATSESKILKSEIKAADWKSLHAGISKGGKVVEKTYTGYSFESNDQSDKNLSKVWKLAVSETLLREGFPTKYMASDAARDHSKSYNQLAEFINGFDDNLESIFEWMFQEFPDSADKENLTTEFIKLLFLKNIDEDNLENGLLLVKKYLKYLKNNNNQKMISNLLTKCLFFGSTSKPEDIFRLKENFINSFCKFKKIPKSDPLTACNEIGTKAIPSLDRLSGLLKGKNYSSLRSDEELPIELPVEEDFVYHSVFCCPVIKQQTSPENPAFLLPCNHALSKEALNRLSKGNQLVRFKCPYCPSETNASNCIQLYF